MTIDCLVYSREFGCGISFKKKDRLGAIEFLDDGRTVALLYGGATEDCWLVEMTDEGIRATLCRIRDHLHLEN